MDTLDSVSLSAVLSKNPCKESGGRGKERKNKIH